VKLPRHFHRDRTVTEPNITEFLLTETDKTDTVMSYDEDDVFSVATFDDVPGRDGDEGVMESDLQEEATSLQRLVVNRMLHTFTRGRMDVAFVDNTMPWTAEKMVRIDPLFQWDSGDPVEIVDALRRGRVRARVNAAMGVGKTTRLAPFIATELNCRVLLVSLNALCLQQVAVYSERTGLGRYRRNRSVTKGAHLCCMTYADFNGFMVGKARTGLFADFDVIVFDEAFVGSADVFCAKVFFAAYSHPGTSLLLASATMQSGMSVGEMESVGQGAFKQLESSVSVADAIASKRLVEVYLKDRTGVFVSSDDDMAALVEHYLDYGVDVKSLDSAASYEDLQEICAWLEGDSTTPRVLVLDVVYGIGFNIPLSFAVIWPERRVSGFREGVFTSWAVPETEEMVSQMRARTGRKMVPGSGGLVMTVERTEASELYMEERLTAFVKLRAGGIRPMRSGRWDEAYRLLPSLEQTTAALILKVGLPVEVVIRYLADDGKFARKYSRSLMLFTQPDHFLMPSEHDEPTSRPGWVVGEIGVGEKGERHSALVPFEATGEVGFAMHVVTAHANGDLQLDRWKPPRTFCFDDGFDSGEEESARRFGVTRRLRRVDPKVEVREVRQIEQPWSFQPTSQSVGELRRGGRFVDTARYREAVNALEGMLTSYKVPDVSQEVSPVESTSGMSEVPLPRMGTVESPGGTAVCLIPATVCQELNVGKVLSATDFMSVVVAVKPCVSRFVASRLFDSLSGPWESIFRTLLDPAVVNHVVKVGESTTTYAVVDEMRKRFAYELVGVLRNSNLTRSRFKKLFRKPPSLRSVIQAVEKGDFANIAQTDAYFRRVVLLQGLMVRVLAAAETASVYLPTQVSEVQRMQYVQGVQGAGTVGRGYYLPYVSHYPMPGSPPPPSYRSGSATPRSAISPVGLTQEDRLRSRMAGMNLKF